MDLSYIREQIDKYGQCKTIALTKIGALAIIGDNGYSRSGSVPQNLLDELARLNANNAIINEVVMKEDGSWLVIYDNYNGVLSSGIPLSLREAIGEAFNLGLKVFCADWRTNEDGGLMCVNDKADLRKRDCVGVRDDVRTYFFAEDVPALFDNIGATYNDKYSWYDYMYDKRGNGTPSFDYSMNTCVEYDTNTLIDINLPDLGEDFISADKVCIYMDKERRVSRSQRTGLFSRRVTEFCASVFRSWECASIKMENSPKFVVAYYKHSDLYTDLKERHRIESFEKNDPFYAIVNDIVKKPWRLKIFGTRYFISNETGTEYYYSL